MACSKDMTAMSAAERRYLVISEAAARNVDRRVATAYMALSEGEMNGVWWLPRPDDTVDELCCRTPVAVETARFHDALFGENDLIAWLQQRGYVTLVDNRLAPAGAIANPANQGPIGAFFEQSVAYYKERGVRKAVEWAGLGPTSLNLAVGGMCGVPETAEEIWAFYMAGDSGDLLLNSLYYLTPDGYQLNFCEGVPALPDGTEATAVAWLNRHAGGGGWGTKLYHGDPSDPAIGHRKPYKQSWADCDQVAAQVYSQF